MNNSKKLIGAVLSALLIITVALIAIRIISGAFHLLGGVLDTILGLVIIVALIIIVIWMFSYAKKKKK